jgi:dinuclear metal center YbgI/SA1388 family protein
MQRDKIVQFCSEYLAVEKFNDTCFNGLQVEGNDTVTKIVGGVSLSERLIKKAIDQKAKMLLVHHSRLNKQIGSPQKITGLAKNRLKLLLKHNINLLGFHVPLDAHPVIGNNISLCNVLGLKNIKKVKIGFYGELTKSLELEKFVEIVNQKLKTKSFVLANGPAKVKKIAIISGGGANLYSEVVATKVDTFITGNIDENLFWDTQEDKINFINAGHYNTEKLGVQNLGKLLAKKFKIEFEFVDFDCEI